MKELLSDWLDCCVFTNDNIKCNKTGNQLQVRSDDTRGGTLIWFKGSGVLPQCDVHVCMLDIPVVKHR